MTTDVALRTPQKPTMDEYGDHELFGPRIESNRWLNRVKAGNDSECAIFAIGTFAGKDKFKLKDLTGTDRRLRQMILGLEIEHAWPVQRYSWPKIENSTFANLFVSPEATGKTHALLLYLVSKCIAAAPMNEADELLNSDTSNQYTPASHDDLDEYIIHPKYIIISSSQDNVDALNRKIDLMKQQAYGNVVTDTQRRLLTPIARTINIHQDSDKLAMRCNESEIIISSPPALLKCLNEGLLNFSKCKRVFFDDLDIALQLQNNTIREIIKIFLAQSQALSKFESTTIQCDSQNSSKNGTKSACQMFMFSRKWTDLVRHFIGNIFPQRILLFASIAEAAIYTHVRFEIEPCSSVSERLSKVSRTISILLESSPKDKIAIVCRTDEEAETTCDWLNEHGHKAKLLREEERVDSFARSAVVQRTARDLLFVISDPALEFEVEYSTRRKPLNDIMHLVHAYLPDDMFTFDQRFRVLYRNIQESRQGMTSSIMLSQPLRPNTARQIYDLISRSGPTLKSTKLIMRDFIANQTSHICWRWATTGLCRLEKLSRDDRFGSYCFDRHALVAKQRSPEDLSDGVAGNGQAANGWPREGLVSMTITHIVSPSEFYFRFEAVRLIDSGEWLKFETSGKTYMKHLQAKLDRLKGAHARSVALDQVRRGKVFGVHFPQEVRVDRVLLLDDLGLETKKASIVNEELEYSRQVRVLKIDYGSRLEVYVRNLLELPEELREAPAQSHRGLHLGYKPTDGEPNWPYKAKREFYDTVCAKQGQTINAWLRFNRDHCFWFEHMLVCRELTCIDSKDVDVVNPYRQLQRLGLAEATGAEPMCLPASNRVRAHRRWEQRALVDASQFAFLDRSAPAAKIFLLAAVDELDILVRLVKFNKQLMELEDQLLEECAAGKLERQEYFEIGTLALARISLPGASVNRVRIVGILGQSSSDLEAPEAVAARRVLAECLDHGDKYSISEDDLFKAEPEHIRKLPFQAIRCKLANLSPSLLANPEQVRSLKVKLIDLTRGEHNINLVILCRLNSQGHAYLYLPQTHNKIYLPIALQLREHNIVLHDTVEGDFAGAVEPPDEEERAPDPLELFVAALMDVLRDLATEELAQFAQRAKDSVPAAQ